mmetsp:Transcript_10345/g.18908  ORF Transcript_10345/g.18908 Transcript_10345/m.18908 type:complete len:82 (-) Transcript_10345:506-751(-)|eukprot:CAMPEP_0178758450 /NCGR_PEP_ID=MMETSP0744-20121128/14395_1 /TAXON_ID=913974 /ORGANISM="Nitzschia punctata, Strain CCMP561" /LENGTH=81 /DNA_ID=CAMNT_0020412821 /DNA_START=289 /DNA_END=534 /DNA_ORIENTATION=-
MSSLLFGRRLGVSIAPRITSSSSSFVWKTSVATRSFASVGDKLPNVELHLGFPPKKYNLADFAKNKSIVLVGLPGAFTPTW